MAQGFNYASKFSPLVDEAFRLNSLTAGIVNQDYDWTGVSTVNVYTIPTVALGNYSMSGLTRYGQAAELENDIQTLTLSQDKAFTFTIDRKQTQDTLGVMDAATALGREVSQVIIPTVDKYRIAAVVTGCPVGHVTTGTITKSNAYEEFLKCQEDLDDDLAPVGGRVAMVAPAFYNCIKLDTAFTHEGDRATGISLNGQVGTIDGVPVVKAPTSYFPAGVDFLITNSVVMPSPVKLQDYKIHMDPPGVNGALIEGRLRYDAFVLTNKANAIAVHRIATSS